MNEIKKNMGELDSYTKELERTYHNMLDKTKIVTSDFTNRITLILNGEASNNIREFLPLKFRRDNGIFFSDTDIAQKIASRINFNKREFFRIYDPCVGAGNLLIPCIERIIEERNFIDHIHLINFLNNNIIAHDIFPSLVKITKSRLAILLANKTSYRNFEINKLFPNITTDDALKNKKAIKATDIVVVNPPFGHMNIDHNYKWTTGKVQAAAVFIDSIISRAETGAEIIAILPDVLRSGSRYGKWREYVAKQTHILKTEIIGRFDEYTDVDVFLFHIKVDKEKENRTIRKEKISKTRIGDLFDIRVGTVVPFRNKQLGKEVPYLTCKETIWWGETKRLSKIRFDGTLFKPPFVTIRRTSSPSEPHRAYATLVKGKRKIAIENHLIVLTPKDGSVKICKELLLILKEDRTDVWLNNRIRCRHLTIDSIKKLPFGMLKE